MARYFCDRHGDPIFWAVGEYADPKATEKLEECYLCEQKGIAIPESNMEAEPEYELGD